MPFGTGTHKKHGFLGTDMAYQCIPLTTKEYKATLAELMKTPAKAKKFNDFSDTYKSLKKVTDALEEIDIDSAISPLKQQQTSCQEGMAKMLDTVYRAMQRQQKNK